MTETLSGLLDIKTLLLVAAIGGSNLGQYLGLTAPAQQESSAILELTAEAQSVAGDALARVAELQRLLAECQKTCGH